MDYVLHFRQLFWAAFLFEKGYKKSRKLLKDFLLGGAAGGRLVFSFENSGQGGPKILSDRLLEFLSHAN